MAASSSRVVGYLVPRSDEVACPAAALPQTTTPAPRKWPRSICILSAWFFMIALVVCSTTGVMELTARVIYTRLRGPEISLTNFSVLNLSITDDRISGNWSIELGLNNPYRRTRLLYTDIKYTVTYSGAPDAPIVDSLGHPLLQRPKSQTMVNFYGSSENVLLSHLTADSMTRDVIDNGAVEFDLVTVALVVGNADHDSDPSGELRLVLTCNGVKVLISPSKSAHPMNATGRASEIPVCDLVRLVDI